MASAVCSLWWKGMCPSLPTHELTRAGGCLLHGTPPHRRFAPRVSDHPSPLPGALVLGWEQLSTFLARAGRNGHERVLRTIGGRSGSRSGSTSLEPLPSQVPAGSIVWGQWLPEPCSSAGRKAIEPHAAATAHDPLKGLQLWSLSLGPYPLPAWLGPKLPQGEANPLNT